MLQGSVALKESVTANHSVSLKNGKFIINTNVKGKGSKGKPLEVGPFPNGKLPKDRPTLVKELIKMGWVSIVDDEEVIFAKHFFNQKMLKQRTILQLLSSPSFGTGLYVMKRSGSSFDIQEIYNTKTQKVQLKLFCYDFDAYSETPFIYVTQEEMGKENFFKYLLKNNFITEDELQYFTSSHSERKRLAKERPTIIMDVLSGKNRPDEIEEEEIV